jgi:hypothetical protein
MSKFEFVLRVDKGDRVIVVEVVEDEAEAV